MQLLNLVFLQLTLQQSDLELIQNQCRITIDHEVIQLCCTEFNMRCEDIEQQSIQRELDSPVIIPLPTPSFTENDCKSREVWSREKKFYCCSTHWICPEVDCSKQYLRGKLEKFVCCGSNSDSCWYKSCETESSEICCTEYNIGCGSSVTSYDCKDNDSDNWSKEKNEYCCKNEWICPNYNCSQQYLNGAVNYQYCCGAGNTSCYYFNCDDNLDSSCCSYDNYKPRCCSELKIC